MKITKSLIELTVIAAVMFQDEKNSALKEIFASEDGFTFIDENRARIHCKSIPSMKYHTITRGQALGAISYNKLESIVSTAASGGENPENKTEQDLAEAKELEDLKAQYEALFGKAAHHNIGVEKLKTLITEKLAESNDQNAGESENNQESA